jgi:hypothetical protein
VNAELIVYERQNDWTIALRRALSGDGVVVRRIALFDGVWEALAEAPASLIAWEIASCDASPLVDVAGQLERCFPRARSVALARSGDSRLRQLAVAAGAVAFAGSIWELDLIAEAARRHWRRIELNEYDLNHTHTGVV